MLANAKPLNREDLVQLLAQIAEHLVNQGGLAELSLDPKDGKLVANLKGKDQEVHTVDRIGRLFADAVGSVLAASSGCKVSVSDSIQVVGAIHLKPDVGCFIQFSGDYAGLLIMNFSGAAAMALYRGIMLTMGMPEEELAQEYTSDEVVDVIGETINQIIGKARQLIEQRYQLVAYNTQPKAIAINQSITMSIVDTYHQSNCRRISLRVDGHPFYLEMALENTEFKPLPQKG